MRTEACSKCRDKWKLPNEAGEAYDAIRTCPVTKCPYEGRNVTWLQNMAASIGQFMLPDPKPDVVLDPVGPQPIFGELNARRM